MKGVSKVFVMFLALFLMLNISFVSASSDNYDFKIVVNYDFDDDEEIDCDLIIDDNKRTIEFSDNDDSYENDFDEFLDLDCNRDFDKIRLYIYDEDNKEIDRKTWDDEDRFNYELNVVDEDENWFEIILNHDFESKRIDCSLKVDSKTYDYEFDENSDSSDLKIKKNFDDIVEFDCDYKIDKMYFNVFDDDGDELEDKVYENKYGFSYDLDEVNKENEVKIQIDHSFYDEEIRCTLELDDGDKETFNFDEDSSSSDFKIIRDFDEKIYFNCNEELDEIRLYIYDDNGDKVADETYDNEDKFEYKFNAGEFEFFVQFDEITLEDDFDCTLYIDGEKEKKYNFDKYSSIGDRRVETDFIKNFEFICEEKVSVNLMIFTVEDDYKDEEKIFEKSYSKVDKFGYDVDNNYVVKEDVKVDKVQQVNVVAEIVKPKVETQNQNLTQVGGELDTKSSQTGDSVKNVNSTSQKVPIVDNSIKDNLAVEDKTSFTSILFGLLLILFGIIILVLILMKMDIIVYDNPKKRKGYRKASEKKDIDFDFLKKKK